MKIIPSKYRIDLTVCETSDTGQNIIIYHQSHAQPSNMTSPF